MSLLQMSVSGAVMISVILGVRAVALYRLPKNILLFLWSIALVRLLVPYSLPCVYSVYSLLERYPYLQFPASTGNNDPALIQNAGAPFIASDTVMEIPETNIDYSHILKIVWLIGVCVCAAFFTIAYLKYRQKFREALPLNEDNANHKYIQDWLSKKNNRRGFLRRTITIRQFDRISTPLTYGIFHPVILLPARHIDWDDKTALEYMLTHEYAHIYYYDAVFKLIVILALCAYWYNPMVWVLYIFANRDIELRCDETVIRSLGGNKKSDYAMMLILMAEQDSGFQPLCSRFSKWYLFDRNNNAHAMRVMQERITAIMKIKKLSLRTAIVGAVLSVSITTAFATSALPTSLTITDAEQNHYNDYEIVMISESPVKAADFKEYEPFGLKFDEKTKILSYQNKRVRYFYDGAEIEDNCSVTRLEYSDAERKGDIDVHTVRQREENGDGSYTVLGKITNLEIDSQEVFQNRIFASFRSEATSDSLEGTSTEQSNSAEVAYTVATVTEDADKSLDDTNGDIIITMTEPSGATTDLAVITNTPVSEATGTVETGKMFKIGITLEEKFQQYEKYGVRYEVNPNGGRGNIYYNNQLAHSFADISPTGSVFSFASDVESDIRIQTVYDENGNLTGVEQIQ